MATLSKEMGDRGPGRHKEASFTSIGKSLCYSATCFHLAHDYTIDLVDAPIQ